MDLLSSSNLIRPLGIAENHFLEVLLSNFSLSRKGLGSELNVQFNNDTPAIWTRTAKYEVQKMIPDFECKSLEYQMRLDAFLLKSEGDAYHFNDADFPFRYASGGTLPILRINKKEYYCLFYRTISPIGWNIANGGCDNRIELLNPVDAIERELREELIIVDLKKSQRYSFADDVNKPLDHPKFAVARRYWKERFSQLDFSLLKEFPVTLKWLDGPDYLTVQMAENDPLTIKGCFLNINAEDFGIEVDKIAKINLDEDAILLDGEIIGNQLVNVVIGLFDVNKLNSEVSVGKTEFFPDYFFWDTKRYDVGELTHIINDRFIPYIDSLLETQEKKQYELADKKFNLCPITRRIIKRYISQETSAPLLGHGPFDVFISFGREDTINAQIVFEFLRQNHINSFFSRETIGNPDFHRAIDDALDSVKCLIAVGTSPGNLRRPWVEYECRAFHNNKLSGLNPDAKIISFISGFKPLYLPLPLRSYQAIEYDPLNMDAGLKELAMRVLYQSN
jgi:hypothetical protein